MMFGMAAPIYYGSLSLQALMGIRHGFKEEKYAWIEKYGKPNTPNTAKGLVEKDIFSF